jgi:hypothetical protein
MLLVNYLCDIVSPNHRPVRPPVVIVHKACNKQRQQHSARQYNKSIGALQSTIVALARTVVTAHVMRSRNCVHHVMQCYWSARVYCRA